MVAASSSNQECIERLWTVSIIAQNGRKRQGSGCCGLRQRRGRRAPVCGLNPLIAQAVMGGGQHVRISMDEVRALDSETARLLHQRLCGWIDPGKAARPLWIPCPATFGRGSQRGNHAPKAQKGTGFAARDCLIGLDGHRICPSKYNIARPKARG
jgi:hypothetical protein